MRDKILYAVSENVQIYGIRKINLDIIASQLKISKKTIYKYFNNKEDIIKTYLNEIIDTDKENTKKILTSDSFIGDKCFKLLHVEHKYNFPSSIINDIKKYYKDEWNKLLELKKYKINSLFNILTELKQQNKLRDDINLSIIALMINDISEKLLDNELLKEYGVGYNQAIDNIVKVVLNGILK